MLHINMLRKWHSPTVTNLWIEGDPDATQEDMVLWREDDEATATKISKDLSKDQHQQLSELLNEYSDVLQNTPGRTAVTEHTIETGEARPIRMVPYGVPHAYRGQVEQEFEEMLAAGIVEPSTSDWAAPIVLVKKKDGTLRF